MKSLTRSFKLGQNALFVIGVWISIDKIARFDVLFQPIAEFGINAHFVRAEDQTTAQY